MVGRLTKCTSLAPSYASESATRIAVLRPRPSGTGASLFFSSRRRHTRLQGDWSSDVCSSDLSRVLLELERVGCELDDLLLPVERVSAPHVDVRAGELDHVVTGARVAAEAKRRDRDRKSVV